jgi:hypothetical protein
MIRRRHRSETRAKHRLETLIVESTFADPSDILVAQMSMSTASASSHSGDVTAELNYASTPA